MIKFTCSNMEDSESQAVPDANSPAAITDTSTPRGRNSWRKHVANPSMPAWVAHCAPRTGAGTRANAMGKQRKSLN